MCLGSDVQCTGCALVFNLLSLMQYVFYFNSNTYSSFKDKQTKKQRRLRVDLKFSFILTKTKQKKKNNPVYECVCMCGASVQPDFKHSDYFYRNDCLTVAHTEA